MIDETTKYGDRKAFEKLDQLREADRPKPPRKEGKSPFDEMLEQSKQLQQGALDTKFQSKATQQAVKELEKQQERQRDQSKDKEKEDDHKKESREERGQATAPGRKVLGKTGPKQQGGSGGHGEGQGYGTKKESGSIASKKLALDKGGVKGAQSGFKMAFAAALKNQSHLPKILPREILNQIVRYVRIGLNQQGGKEIELDLHKQVFKGLRLRLSSSRGKVRIHFLTANQEVKALFEKETSAIQEKLEAKGIAVENIMVT